LVRLFGRSHLKSVVFEGDAPAVDAEAFWGVAAGAKAYRDPQFLGYGGDGDNFYGLIVVSSPDSFMFKYDTGEVTGPTSRPNGQAMSSRVVIPETINGKPVTSIGANAFRNLGLTNVVIPATVTKIGDGAFADNQGLRSIVIGNRVRTIGANAFSRDTSLETVKIGSRVISIGANAFADDTALKSVTFAAKAPTVGVDAFKGVPFGAKAIRAAGLTGYGPNGNLWKGLIVWKPGAIAVPTVSVSTTNLAQNAASFTIKGKGFVAGKPSAHQVTFSNGAVGTVTAATATRLTVKFSTQPTSTGALTAIVTSVGGKSGVAKQVATVVALPL